MAFGVWLTKKVFDSWLLLAALIAIVFVLIKNIDVLKSSPPLPGKGGSTLLNTAIIGKQTEGTYRSCLWGYIQGEPGNQGLQSAAGACEARRAERFWACMAEVKSDFVILNKEAHCVGDAGKVWTPCAEQALSVYGGDYTPVQNCAQGKTIDIIRGVAGSQSGQTP